MYPTTRRIQTVLLLGFALGAVAPPTALAEPRGPGNASNTAAQTAPASVSPDDRAVYRGTVTASVSPDDRAFYRGTITTSPSPDDRAFYRGAPAGQIASPNTLGQPSRIVSPDDRPLFRGVRAPDASGRVVFAIPDEFQWGDAGIGAAMTLALILLLGSMTIALRQRRRIATP